MPKKPEVNEDEVTLFRRDPGAQTVVSKEGYRFYNRKKKANHPVYKQDWRCTAPGCPAYIFVTGEWEGDDDGFMRGAVMRATHGTGKGAKKGRPHPPPAAQPEAENIQDIAANMTALALEEPEPAEDQPSTSRAAAAPQEPTMRALKVADNDAAVALARAALPDLPQHMREMVIDLATKDRSSHFAHGFFASNVLVGLIIGWKDHWTKMKRDNTSPLSEERTIAQANRWRTAYIALLAVDANHRTQGIGRALVGAFLDDVQPADDVLPGPPTKPALQEKPPNIMYLHVRESNEGAVKFYKKLKFERHPRKDVRYYGTEDGLIYVRRLERRSASESRVPKGPRPSSKPGPKPKPRDKSTGRAKIQF